MRALIHVLLLAVFLSACSPGLMVYNTTNALNFTAKGQTKINLFTNFTHGELQYAYSPKDKLGLFANSYYEFANVGSLGTYHGEIACGHYSGLKKQNWYYDTYGGVGAGSRKYHGGWNNFFLYNHNDDGIISDYSSFYSKFFSQSSIYHRSERSELAFTLQVCLFHFNSYQLQLDTFIYGGAHTSHRYSADQKNVLNMAPSITYKYLWKHFGFVFQLTSNLEITNPEFISTQGNLTVYNYAGAKSLNFNSRPLALNVGLQIQFGE